MSVKVLATMKVHVYDLFRSEVKKKRTLENTAWYNYCFCIVYFQMD